MKRVAILYVCIGKYALFWKDFFESVESHFLKECHIEYFVFTDANITPITERATIIECEKLGWPFDTLMRFHMFYEIKDELSNFDYLYFMNANMLVQGPIGSEILPQESDFIGVIHPGFYNKPPDQFTYERRPQSRACMNPEDGAHYFMGAFNGGKAEAFLRMSAELASDIDDDLERDIVAVWHDESHLNQYFWTHRSSVKILSPSYCYPEGWSIPFETRILLRDKRKYGGHLFLRSVAKE